MRLEDHWPLSMISIPSSWYRAGEAAIAVTAGICITKVINGPLATSSQLVKFVFLCFSRFQSNPIFGSEWTKEASGGTYITSNEQYELRWTKE